MPSRTTTTRTAILVLSALLAAAPRAGAFGARSFKSGPIQITADGAWVWVVNPDNDSVSRIHTSDGVVTEYVLPATGVAQVPRGLSVREDGSEVWVACEGSDRVVILAGLDGPSGAAGSVLGTVLLPWGSAPYSVALSRDQQQALVACHRSGTIAFVDAASRAITSLQPVFQAPLGICFLENGTEAWVSHPFADFQHTRMTRIDLTATPPLVTTELRVDGSGPQNNLVDFGNDSDPSHHVAEGGYLTFRGHFAQKPGNGRLWVPTQYDNIHQDSPTPDSIIQAVIRTLDLSTRTMPNTVTDKTTLTAVAVHDMNANNLYKGPGWNAPVSGPLDIAFSADGTVAWLVFEQSDNVLVFPTATPDWKPDPTLSLTTIDVGHRPIGLCVSPVADRAYVANDLSRSVSVLDLAANTVLAQLPTTPVTGERLSASILNGARLFHTSNDPRISSNRKVSCASCHINGETDGRQWDLQFMPGLHGPRQVQSLLGLSATFGPPDPLTHFGQLHRTGDRDEVQDFDFTFTGLQMGGTGFIPSAQRQPPLGAGPNAGLDADLDDIAAYVLSLPAIARSPYRAANGSLTPAAVRGATFFQGSSASKPADAGCATCHVPETGFTDFAYHDVGSYRYTTTTAQVGSFEKELNDSSRAPYQWQVNTAGLVGAFATEPYVGATAQPDVLTMGDLLDDCQSPQHAAPHGTLAGLNRRQLRDLEAFLLSIDGDLGASQVRAAVDRQPPRIARVHALSPTTISVWFDESVKPSAAVPAAWKVTDSTGGDVPVTAATLDAAFTDRVWLTTAPLPRSCAITGYTVQALGPISDLADTASGGVANALDPADPANTVSFTLPDTITVTLGASGNEDLTVVTHDASNVNPALATYGNSSVWLLSFPQSGGAPLHNSGFVRFEWEQAFQAATGVTDPNQLVAASLSISGWWGDSEPVEVRRVLQRWWDPGTWHDHLNNPVNAVTGHGGPTWTSSESGVRTWNQPNAQARAAGVDGGNASDYFGANDTGNAPDLATTMPAINAPFAMGGAGILDAYRFWYQNPTLDWGHAISFAPSVNNETKFHAGEQDLGVWSPVLSITYQLPAASGGTVPTEVSAATAPQQLLVVKDPGGVRLSFEDLGPTATSYSVYEGGIAIAARPWYSHQSLACNVTPTPVAGHLELVVHPLDGLGARYLLVTASSSCAESTSGSDSFGTAQPAALLTCSP